MDNEHGINLFDRIASIKPNPARIFPIAICITVILVTVVIIVAIKFAVESHLSTIDLLYTPASATATIDGKEYTSGKIQLPPGTHETHSSQTTPAHFALEPNESFTTNWYENNYNDALIAQGISSQQFNEQRASTLEKYPALKELSIEQKGFTIYQATCNGTQVCIMIDASNAYRNEAIEFLRKYIDQDLGRYYFSFRNYSNPFLGEG